MKQQKAKKLLVIGPLFFMLWAVFAWQAQAETFFVYIEELDGNSQPAVFTPLPAIKEGFLDGLFEQGHIIFDDSQGAVSVDWEKSNFKKVINTALAGGARYLVAVKSVTKTQKAAADQVKIEQSANYYIFDVEKVLLIKEGKLSKTDVEKSKGYDPSATGFRFGKELSLMVNRIWEKIEDHNNSLAQN